MFEWQVTEDEESFASPQEEADVPSRRWRVPWRLLLLIIVGSAALAFGILRWRVAERDAAIRRDIIRFVTEEERSRLFGLTENLPRLVARDVPDDWQAAYLGTFLPPDEAQSLPVEVDTIELHGADGALVTVRLDDQPQVRYYRLEEGRGWRRAPLPREAIGEMVRAPVGSVQFYGLDESFGRNLAYDLPALREEINQWGGWSFPTPIQIAPREFQPPLIQQSDDLILLNSPLFLSYPRAINGEEAVRFALAQALFRRAGPDLTQEIIQFTPPASVTDAVGGNGTRTTQSGVGRFVDAARNVSAMRWALSPEEQEQLRERWREELHAERWFSPFLTSPQTRQFIDVENPTRAEASALLAADYLYESRGPEIVAAIVNGTAEARSWDSLFQETIGRYAVELDQEVSAYARGGMAAVERQVRSAAPIMVPFQVTGAQPLPGSLSQIRAEVIGAEEPILIQATDADVQMPDGTSIPPDCVSLDTSMEVDGDWLELGTRLRATHISLSEVLPPSELDIIPAPPETVAYLIEPTSASGEPVATLLALQPDGTAIALADVSNMQVSPVIQPSGYSTRFLVQLQVPGCNWIWILLYDPTIGVVRRWLAPPTFGFVFMQALWHPNATDADDLLAFIYPRASSGAYYTLLEDGGPLLVEPAGRLPGNTYPLGIQAASNQMVMMSWGEGQIKFLDPLTGDLGDPVYLASRFITSINLSANGRFLAYVPTAQPDAPGTITFPATARNPTLHILSLPTGEEQALAFPGEVIHALLGNQMGNQVLAVIGPNSNNGLPPAGSRLVAIDPANPQQQAVVAVLTFEEEIPWAFSCPDIGVIYQLTRRATSGQFPVEVRLWSSWDGSTTTLLQTNRQLQPLACP